MSERVVTVGIDVGGTSTRVVAFDDAGAVLAVRRASTPSGADALIELLTIETTSIIAGIEGVDSQLDTVGVGIPGRVERSGSVSMALNVGITDAIDLGDRLASRLDADVHVENDVNAAALGAHSWLAGGPSAGLTLLSIGTGLAAGFVLDGKIVAGSTGSAGEIGHLPFPGATDACACGQTGCIESIVSGRAIVDRMRSVGMAGTAEALWDAADEAHLPAVSIRDDVISALAWTCQLTGFLLDVDHIVLGGGVSSSLGTRLLDLVVDDLARREATSPLLASMALSRRIDVVPAGVEVGAIGADRAARAALRPQGCQP